MLTAKRVSPRITTRVTPQVQEKLESAANILGSTVNQFVVQAALEKAQQVIAAEQSIRLTERGSLQILELMESPPVRNGKFRTAMARYQRVVEHTVIAPE